MPWVEFTARFIYTPDEDRRGAVAYPAGYKGNVRKQCADKALAAGAAVRTSTPPRPEPEA